MVLFIYNYPYHFMIVIILPLNFIGRNFIIILDCVVLSFLCLFLNFAKLRCAHFPSYLLFLSVQFLVWFLGYWFFFTKMGQIFVKLTIFYRDTINLLWLRRYSYNAVFSLKDASFHSICLYLRRF